MQIIVKRRMRAAWHGQVQRERKMERLKQIPALRRGKALDPAIPVLGYMPTPLPATAYAFIPARLGCMLN